MQALKLRRWQGFLLLLLLTGTGVARGSLTQIRALNFDFDDNIMVTGAKNMLWDKINQREVGLTTAEWALVRDKVGKEEPWKHFELRANALRFFGDTTPLGTLLFRRQLEEAMSLPDEKWKGPFWNEFVSALARPETRRHTTLITARLHAPSSMVEGLRALQERGLIPALPDERNIFPVGWPGLPEQFKGTSSTESKAKVMLSLLDGVEAQPVPKNATLVENQDGTGPAPLHLWEFSDDDFANYDKARVVLSKQVALGRWPHVKVVLWFTGLNHPGHRPHSVVIRTDGTTRPTVPSER